MKIDETTRNFKEKIFMKGYDDDNDGDVQETYHKKSPSKKYKRCKEAIITTNNMMPPLNNDTVVVVMEEPNNNNNDMKQQQQRDSSDDDVEIANDTADRLLAMLITVSFLLKI